MSNASKGSRRRGAARLVVPVATIVGLGVVASGAAAAVYLGACATFSCGLSAVEWSGLVVAAIGGAAVVVAALRLAVLTRPSRGAGVGAGAGARPRRSAGEPMSPPERPDGEGAARPARSGAEEDETICPSLADWIARARRGGEGGGART
jgi:hypothetical protein